MMWFSPAFTAQTGLDMACVGDRSRQPTSHDALFSTVLGLFDVQTSVHRPGRDLLLACRTAPAGQLAGSP